MRPTKAGAVSVCSLLCLWGLAQGLAHSGAPHLFIVMEESVLAGEARWP